MKVGIFGGIIFLILALIFANVAINNNKIAVNIVEKTFNDFDEKNSSTLPFTAPIETADTNSTASSAEVDEWSDFEKKFDKFDDKFKNF